MLVKFSRAVLTDVAEQQSSQVVPNLLHSTCNINFTSQPNNINYIMVVRNKAHCFLLFLYKNSRLTIPAMPKNQSLQVGK